MSVLPKVCDFVAEQRSLLDSDLNLVANNVIEYIQAINHSEYATGKVWGSRELDFLVIDIGKCVSHAIEINTDKTSSNRTYVYIATELHKTGGHTAALFEIIKSKKDCRHVIFVTDTLDGFDQHGFREYLAESLNSAAELFVVPEAELHDKTAWLLVELNKLSPKAMFLFNHHEDVVAVASAQENICEDIYYYHHADHHLALGVCLEYALHIDPHNIGYFNCRDHLHKKNNIYWPLVIEDKGCRSPNDQFMEGGELKTCTCAGANKVETPYTYEYKDIVLGRLKNSPGVHYHVGWLTDEYLGEIRISLQENMIDENRFIYIQWVDSVWSFLNDNKIDLYISSFPLGGGTTTIECMGSGTPLLMHDTYKTKFHSGIDIAYRNVMRWSMPHELYDILNNMNSRVLAEHSSMGRAYYIKHYCSERLLEVLADEESMRVGVAPPELTNQDSDIDSVIKTINFLESEDNKYRAQLKAMREERDIAVSECDSLNHMRDAAFKGLNTVTSERDAAINERDAAINERDAVIVERDKAIEVMNSLFSSRTWRFTEPLRIISARIMRKKSDD